ncbi:MAG TPA: 4-(cytidine 5'-diphospho)-2-C-methyl-D-erythritol kinase [Chitinophagaceae bacterium]|nr:4-(cytidine 5'-diphospho)-2-C-methyl-D-erythritol kinase [Chitinophagaceae bacterium]
MVVFPNCKINLGLQVLQKRTDGYHDLSTIFYPVPLKDVLEIVPGAALPAPAMHMYGLPINGDTADNLCLRAWQLLKADHPLLPAPQVHLLKNIPMGAGLGGGSADGAFMLLLLNQQYRLELNTQQLMQYALQLGSDCPFFILNQPALGGGRGEALSPLPLRLTGYTLLLANPGIHVSTAWAFAQLAGRETAATRVSLREAVERPITEWKELLTNDFEAAVFAAQPAIAREKEEMYALGALYAAMSGSGSAVYGIFAPGHKFTGGLPARYAVIQL